MRIRTATIVAIACALVMGAAAPAAAATDPTSSDSWTADLAAGDPAGVVVVDGAARLAGQGAFRAPTGTEETEKRGGTSRAGAGAIPTGVTGFLTFAPHELATATDRIDADIESADPTGTDTAGSHTTGSDAPGGDTAGIDATSGDTAGMDKTRSDKNRSDKNRGDQTGRDNTRSAKSTDTAGSDTPGDDTADADKNRADKNRGDKTGGDKTGTDTVGIDIRGQRPDGGWTEWIPADDDGHVTLPERTDTVQGRLVLTGDATVTGVSLTPRPPAARSEGTRNTEGGGGPLSARVFATREGLVGGTTSNGHVITERDLFVALPSRRALSPNGSGDYSVKICAANGRCAFVPVWDIGPWNTRDDYWNGPDQRQDWKDLPVGKPEAQAAFQDGYNGGRDQFGRKAANPAGIDLADGTFWDALMLKDNSWVQVDYLWTGSGRQAKVGPGGPAKVLAAPKPDAPVVGLAATSANVPVECSVPTPIGPFIRIGKNQYLFNAALPGIGAVPPCTPAITSSTRAASKPPTAG